LRPVQLDDHDKALLKAAARSASATLGTTSRQLTEQFSDGVTAVTDPVARRRRLERLRFLSQARYLEFVIARAVERGDQWTSPESDR
jgi:hypothetical protein